MKKKKILLTLGIAAMMGLAGCGETPAPSPSTPEDPPVVVVDPVVTGISISAEGGATSVELGKTLKFTAEVSGEGDFNKQYTFSVDKEDIATISNEGVLTPKAEGSVRVTATASGDTSMKASLDIAVNEVAKIEIKDVVKDKRQHVVGKITALTTRSFVVDDGTGAVLVFTKTAPEGYAIGDVVSVAGVVTEYHNNLQFPETSVIKKTEGTIENTTIASPTAITAASYDEMAETLTALKPVSFWGTIFKEGDYLAVKVEDGSTHLIEPTDVPDSISLVVGTAYNITGYLAPYYEKYSYNGLFVTSATVKPIPVTSLTVNSAGGATSMGLNETLQMSVTVAPEKATNKAVTWSVDKTDVATIDENGLLTSVAAGTVVVTATAKDGSGVTGTKSIEVLQFKDPVVSLTLGTAPTETILGDGDIDVTVTVAGESSTSNFNPAYSATSSDTEVATVTATETGIKITPVAAGTVTVTVKTTGTNASGEQLTKTISLTVLGEPRVKQMTVSEAMNWRPTDLSATYTDKSQLVEITGVCDYTNVGNNYFYISDGQGGSVQGFKLFSDGEFAYDTASHEYSFTKGGEATAIKTDLNMKGKEITIKGTLCYYKNASSGAITMEVTNGTFTVGEAATPTIIDATKDTEGGSYEIQAEGLAFDSTVTINNIAAEAGYKLGSVVIDQAYTIYNPKSFTDNGDGTSKITFKACNYNKVEVNFVPDDGLAAKTVAEAVTIAESLQLLNNRNPISGYVRVTGVLDSIADLAKGNFVLRDTADNTKAITAYGVSALKDLLDAGQAGIGYKVTLDVQIQNYGGTLELVNAVNVTADSDGIAGYTITKGDAENGEIASIKIGENEVTGPVAPGTVVTVTLLPDSGYKTSGLHADNSAVVTADSNNVNVFTVKIYGDTTLTPSFVSDDTKVASLAYAAGQGTGNLGTVSDGTKLTYSGDNPLKNTDAATAFGLDSTIFLVTGAKNSTSNFPGVNNNGYIALYGKKDTNAGDGASMTISLKNTTQYTINSIKVNFSTTASMGVLAVYGSDYGGANPQEIAMTDEDSYEYTINDTAVTLKNVVTANTNQIKISSIVISYTKLS